jgi:aspartate-semialdehyde dehydrogenase
LNNERNGIEDGPMAYKYKIDLNAIPQIDVFLDNGYTKEEMKMVNETRKIMRDDNIMVTATTVRIPVMGGHSESVNVEFADDFSIDEVKQLCAKRLVLLCRMIWLRRFIQCLYGHMKKMMFLLEELEEMKRSKIL